MIDPSNSATAERNCERNSLLEAYALHEVYRGIHYAAVALACHEKAIRKLL